ncbi:MAG: 4-(cytidine 5'-diphospho)-2-C-methyl-D-erythritol kinase [Treponema sp.]|nr:4-(cytidine 5'-diphospho)-2-C-methyl-D-erythritol kinase [Treponema sp.]
MTAGVLRVKAPCKVNLHLRILEKRPDGFHNLESVFALLDFGDSLEVSLLPGASGALDLVMKPESRLSGAQALAALPAEQNLVYRAAALFRDYSGFAGNFSVKIGKFVPPGSGLGGGSSDAAAALLAFNSFAGNPLSREKLLDIGAKLGSDVPFFVSGEKTAWVSGRGEVFRPLFPSLSDYGVLLVFSDFQSSTAAAYRLLDDSRTAAPAGAPAGEAGAPEPDVLQAALGTHPSRWPFTNDFSSVFLGNGGKEQERYTAVFDSLKNSGALFWGLSGSGSVCFGIYGSKTAAKRAKISMEKKFFMQITNFLAIRSQWQ